MGSRLWVGVKLVVLLLIECVREGSGDYYNEDCIVCDDVEVLVG